MFVLPGAPRGKGRPRSRIARSRAGDQFIAVYTDAETRNYEAALKLVGSVAMKRAGLKVLSGPLRVRITAVFPIPKSWSQNKRSMARVGLIKPTVKPDCDNIAKMLDGVNGVVWVDDSNIVQETIEKVYGDDPELRVEVWRSALHMLFEAEAETD